MEEKILELIEGKNYTRLRSLLAEMNPADIAQIFNDVPKDRLIVVFRILPKELSAEVFTYLESDMQQLVIEAFSDAELREVLDELFLDDTVDIIDEMPASVAKRIITQTDSDTRKKINQLLAYPDDSAGSIMTTEYIDLKKDMTVEEAIEKIRRIGENAADIYTC
jgi:magnesium transporter